MPPDATSNLAEHLLSHRALGADGGRTAVITRERSWSYAEVEAEASRWAGLLEAEGVARGDRVMLALPDGLDYVAALFGILKRGAVVVMVNPDLPVPQIAYLYGYVEPALALVDTSAVAAFREALEAGPAGGGMAGSVDSDATSEITADSGPTVGAAAPASSVPILETGTDTLRARLDALPDRHPAVHAEPDHPAVLLFSGGTTGHPKAVVQTHGSFLNTTRLYGHGVLQMGPDDVTLSVPKLYFGYATGINLFFPFSVGAACALFPERCTTDALFDAIERFRPTVLVNVPTMVNHMLGDDHADERDLSSLRLATSAGEALPVDLHRRWNERWGVPLLDGLGTAEMWHIFISNRIGDVRPGTLGRVVPGFTVQACDDAGREVEPGQSGVMRVQGDSLALGYWRDPDKTAAAFRDGGYVSGDMISIDRDGYVTYRGRADDMLKVSGKWLSPREVEDCLLAHEAVREVAVVGVPTHDGLVKPWAFVVPEDADASHAALADELQTWAKSRMEPYKYPREVTFVEDLPRTHLGKVDRGRLAREARS